MEDSTPVGQLASEMVLGPSAGPKPGLLSPTLAGKSVLICEDDGITLLQIARALTRVGATIAGVAATGSEALHLTEHRRPDIVLVDVDLTEEDGLALAERMLGGIARPCVVIVTVADDPATRARAAELGASGFVGKPLASDCLVPQVERAYEAWAASTSPG